MEKVRFVLFSIVVLSLIGILGFWSIKTLQSGSEHSTSQKIKQLEQENKDLKNELEDSNAKLEELIPKEAVEESVPEEDTKLDQPTTYKYQNLIDELEKLVTDGVVMKLKSSGTRVGTVQNFLNIYNKTSNRIDNDYGASTQKAVTAFQKAVGLKATGEAGVTTFNKMIDWLKKQ